MIQKVFPTSQRMIYFATRKEQEKSNMPKLRGKCEKGLPVMKYSVYKQTAEI